MDIEKFVNSKAYYFFDWLLKLLVLNILTMIFSIGIVTILPSLIACFQSIKDYKDGSSENVFYRYFKNFKNCFKRSIGIWIIILIIGAILYISLMYYYQNIISDNGDITNTWIVVFSIGRYFSLFGLLYLIIILIQLPIIFSYFYFRAIDNLRFAIYVSFKYIINSLLSVLPWLLSILFLFYITQLWFIIGLSIPMYLNYYISRSTYLKIINQSRRNKGEENDEIRN